MTRSGITSHSSHGFNALFVRRPLQNTRATVISDGSRPRLVGAKDTVETFIKKHLDGLQIRWHFGNGESNPDLDGAVRRNRDIRHGRLMDLTASHTEPLYYYRGAYTGVFVTCSCDDRESIGDANVTGILVQTPGASISRDQSRRGISDNAVTLARDVVVDADRAIIRRVRPRRAQNLAPTCSDRTHHHACVCVRVDERVASPKRCSLA